MNIYGSKEHALRAKREEAGIFAVNSAFSLSRVARHTPSRRLDWTVNLSGIPTI